MSVTAGILVFDGVDELDFVGPLDVFSYAAEWGRNGNEVAIIAAEVASFRGVNGLTFTPQYDFANAPELDVIVVPGGHGTKRLVQDERILTWLRGASGSARWICSVCTGSFVLQAAGLVDGKQITTHSGMIEQLKSVHAGDVVSGERFVVDGNVVTSAGVSAGIDAALWVVGELYGPAHAQAVRQNLDYNPLPPY